MAREEHPEEQNLSVTQHLSGKMKATGYGEVNIPSDWVFIDPEREDKALISRIVARGPYRRCWEQTSAWHSKFKGYYAPRSLVHEEQQKLMEERDQLLKGGKQETLNLIVYEVGDWQQEGVSEEHFGRIPIPQGWGLLESGDALLTRRVKARGKYWEYFREFKTKAYNKKIGIFTPVNIIEAESKKISSERSTKKYKQRLESSRKSREKHEAKYRQEFAEACFRFLYFVIEHEDLAWQIAWGATSIATEVGSSRVGRTSKLSLEDKTELAVRAFIRHNFTDYDERLNEMGEPWYQEIRGVTAADVNHFLEEHRGNPSG